MLRTCMAHHTCPKKCAAMSCAEVGSCQYRIFCADKIECGTGNPETVPAGLPPSTMCLHLASMMQPALDQRAITLSGVCTLKVQLADSTCTCDLPTLNSAWRSLSVFGLTRARG